MTHTFKSDSRRGRNVFSLNGPWEITPSDDANSPRQYPYRISVPSVVDCAEPPYHWQSAAFHWYRTTFRLEVTHDKLVFLKIGQSQFGTDVWMNGIHVGRSISCYTSHEYEIRQFLLSAGRENEVVVRVGTKENLPAESAVGEDREKSIYTPGIWGDVMLVVSGNPRLSGVQIIPDIHRGSAEVRMTVENRRDTPCSVTVTAQSFEKKKGREASHPVQVNCTVPAFGSASVSATVIMADPHLWSPDSPFLYEMLTSVHSGSEMCDEVKTTFGLREFKIEGKSFLLNGGKIVLKGGNIAFHRFLADKERALLPWDRSWIKRALIDIPKRHHFNFFRNHLGQLYPLWYDIADEEGMLIQNEWHFWGTTGSREQIRREFNDWLKDNWNHPSIVIWDPLNESTNDFVQNEIVPEMKKIDPTRPWESVDFVEEHPYIYSLGPVLNEGPFGFTRPILDIEHSQRPVVLNEFLWWWVDNAGQPTSLMEGVVQRWLGRTWTPQLLLEHQSFLVRELIELFRRMDVSAIQPFVYLSNNDGPTANWFQGPIAELQPKPLLAAIGQAYAPFGISIELWDRHFTGGEQRTIRVFVFNDTRRKAAGTLHWGFKDATGAVLSDQSEKLSLDAHEHRIVEIHTLFPQKPGRYTLQAELQSESVSETSIKPVHVFPELRVPAPFHVATMGLSEETRGFLASSGIECMPFPGEPNNKFQVLVVGEGQSRMRVFASLRSAVSEFVRGGGSIVLLEPEFGVDHNEFFVIEDDVQIEIKKREDRDKGGYDSYVFMEDSSHPIWEGIAQEHLFLFNGALGGEIISQHDVMLKSPHAVMARCGLNLGVVALAEAPLGSGRVLVSRLQTRGRLGSNRDSQSLFDRRIDPVARQYLVNLLWYASNGQNNKRTFSFDEIQDKSAS
ncbi:MAG: glycoside hydrolase family 2 TIM barrel-domain containing protein [Bacteroidota bacterium]